MHVTREVGFCLQHFDDHRKGFSVIRKGACKAAL